MVDIVEMRVEIVNDGCVSKYVNIAVFDARGLHDLVFEFAEACGVGILLSIQLVNYCVFFGFKGEIFEYDFNFRTVEVPPRINCHGRIVK